MRKILFALGSMLAVTIAGVAWAHQSTSRIAAHVETVDLGTGGAATSVNGRVTSVDVSARTVTIDMARTSTDFNSINTGDEVQIQLATDAVMAGRGDVVSGAAEDGGAVNPRRLLGLCLLAMTGTTVVLRARRPRTI